MKIVYGRRYFKSYEQEMLDMAYSNYLNDLIYLMISHTNFYLKRSNRIYLRQSVFIFNDSVDSFVLIRVHFKLHFSLGEL